MLAQGKEAKARRSNSKRNGKNAIVISAPKNATKNGESLEDLTSTDRLPSAKDDSLGVGVAHTTNRRTIMSPESGAPFAPSTTPDSPPSPQSTLASFRFGSSSSIHKSPSVKRVSPPPAPEFDNTADIVPDVIQFRSPLSRQQTRVLYDGNAVTATPPTRTYVAGSSYFESRRKSSASTASSWHTPGSDGRRQSLVKPEDYLPGLPVSANAGKAMSAGFEPPERLPAVSVSLFLHDRASI